MCAPVYMCVCVVPRTAMPDTRMGNKGPVELDKGIDSPPDPVPSSDLRSAVFWKPSAGPAHAGEEQGPGVVDGAVSVPLRARGARNRYTHTVISKADERPES